MQDIAHDAARLLWACREAGTVLDALPPALRPNDPMAGHAIQSALPAIAGRPVVGWKIAATSAAGQAHIQVDGPLAGRILDAFVQPIGTTFSLAGNRMRVVEPEFAFRMGAPLPPRAAPYAADEVRAAVASLHPAFELPDSRFADFARAGKAQLIADDACCGQFAFGPAAPAAWRSGDLAAHRVQATVFGADGRVRCVRDGEGRALLGDPLTALIWLANELSALGIGLRAGDWASCGTCMVPLAIEPGDRVVADYGAFGRIEMGLEGESAPMTNRTTVERTSERELVVTRIFNAPPQRVFEAWARADLFQRWWAPKSTGMSLLSCETDVRVGGMYRLEFGHEASEPMAFFGRYIDVVPDSRLAWNNDEEGGGAVTTVTFEESGGRTLLVLHELHPSKEALDDAIAGTEGCMPEQFAQLDDLLATLGASERPS